MTDKTLAAFAADIERDGVRELEAEGLTRSDAQGVADATANMEDDYLHCAHTDEKIECAYPPETV